MTKDINYTLPLTLAECFMCKETFNLFEIQKLPINFCNNCRNNSKLNQLTTVYLIMQDIVKYAEQKNIKIADKLVVDISDLVDYLQK